MPTGACPLLISALGILHSGNRCSLSTLHTEGAQQIFTAHPIRTGEALRPPPIAISSVLLHAPVYKGLPPIAAHAYELPRTPTEREGPGAALLMLC